MTMANTGVVFYDWYVGGNVAPVHDPKVKGRGKNCTATCPHCGVLGGGSRAHCNRLARAHRHRWRVVRWRMYGGMITRTT